MSDGKLDAPESPIAPGVLLFIARYIQTVEQLEILCILVETPHHEWSVREIVRRVQSAEASVQQCLETFAEHGLAERGSERTFRFSHTTSDLTNSATNLVRAYRERRVAIIAAIYERTDSNWNRIETLGLARKK